MYIPYNRGDAHISSSIELVSELNMVVRSSAERGGRQFDLNGGVELWYLEKM